MHCVVTVFDGNIKVILNLLCYLNCVGMVPRDALKYNFTK